MSENIGNKVNNKTYIPLPPFKGWVLENFPFIEADFDCLTNYEMICKMITEINNVISNQNQVQDLGTELVTAYNALVDAVNLAINAFEEDITGDFNDLQDYVDNYFDNNFPQLVSNKLDEMASDGTLENLLNDEAHLIKVYATYSDLITASASFTNGLKLMTLGYYAINDGGAAKYYVSNTSSNTNYQVELSNDLYLNLVNTKGVINVLQLGVKNDGVTNTLTELQNVNDSFENTTLYLPAGTYLINNTFYVSNNNCLELNSAATIKASTSMNYLVVYNKQNISEVANRTFKKFIKGGTLDGNDYVNEAVLSLQGVLGFTVSDIKILNFNKYGIKTKIEDTGVNEAIFDNIYIRNDTVHSNSVGIYNNANDCKFSNIIIRDTHAGILTITGYFDYVHGWIGQASLIPDSYFMKTLNNNVIANNCYADTYQYPFISTFGSLNITNAFILNNNSVYDATIQGNYPPTLFKAELDTFNLNTYGYFKVVNSQIDTSHYETVALVNRYNANNLFDGNYFTNYTKLSNKNYFNLKEYKGAFTGSADSLFVSGTYSVSNSNTGIPGAYLYGIIDVKTATTTNGAYITNSDTTYLAYSYQEFTTSETVPKKYFRMYTKSTGWSAWEKVTSTTQS